PGSNCRWGLRSAENSIAHWLKMQIGCQGARDWARASGDKRMIERSRKNNLQGVSHEGVA
ncbi:MAG TPA: hypothetical protein PKE45_01995, partial [Caldilineaceae bacterium]|nr:hypothetical protein [Caldilineaceae bacterium]